MSELLEATVVLDALLNALYGRGYLFPEDEVGLFGEVGALPGGGLDGGGGVGNRLSEGAKVLRQLLPDVEHRTDVRAIEHREPLEQVTRQTAVPAAALRARARSNQAVADGPSDDVVASEVIEERVGVLVADRLEYRGLVLFPGDLRQGPVTSWPCSEAIPRSTIASGDVVTNSRRAVA